MIANYALPSGVTAQDHLPILKRSYNSRNPWPIFLIAYFIVFISGIIAFISFAMRQDMDLVRLDYYEEELRFQNHLNRVARTQPFLAQTAVLYHAPEKRITVTLPPEHASQTPAGYIQFFRPSDARLDRRVQLAVDPQGAQHLDAAGIQEGLWNIRVFWEVSGQEYFFAKPLVLSARLSE